MDVGDDTTAGDGRLDERVELLITANGELKVARGDTLHLEILGSVACQLENLSGKVLEDSCAVDGSCGTDTAIGRAAELKVAVDTTDGELEAGPDGARHGLGLSLLLLSGLSSGLAGIIALEF